jgi:hypothetical protein
MSILETLNLGGNIIQIAVVILKSVFALKGSSPNNTPKTKKGLTDRLKQLKRHRDLDQNEINEIVDLIGQLKTVPEDTVNQLLPAMNQLRKVTTDIKTKKGLVSALKSIFKIIRGKRKLSEPEKKKERNRNR